MGKRIKHKLNKCNNFSLNRFVVEIGNIGKNILTKKIPWQQKYYFQSLFISLQIKHLGIKWTLLKLYMKVFMVNYLRIVASIVKPTGK